MAEQEELVKDTQSDPLPPLKNIYFLFIKVCGAKNLPDADLAGTSDPFCVVTANKQTWRTKTIDNQENPEWNESTSFVFFEPCAEVKFQVFDEDSNSKNDPIGHCSLPVKDFYNQGNQGFPKGEIKLSKKGCVVVEVTGRMVDPLDLEQRCVKLKDDTERQANEINDKKAKCDTLMGKNGELEKKKQSLLHQQNDLNDQLNKLRDQIAAEKQENNKKREKLESLEVEKNKLKEKIKDKKNKIASKRQELDQENQKYGQQQEENKSLKQQAAQYREEQGYKAEDLPSHSKSSNKSALKQPLISDADRKKGYD